MELHEKQSISSAILKMLREKGFRFEMTKESLETLKRRISHNGLAVVYQLYPKPMWDFKGKLSYSYLIYTDVVAFNAVNSWYDKYSRMTYDDIKEKIGEKEKEND